MGIYKQGQWSSNRLVEPYLQLSDGSMWQLLLYHLVDSGTRLFTSSNCQYCNDFGLYSRLKWIDSFVYDSKYEFYVIQDGVEHRWTQTNQPTANAIADLTVITGNPVNGLAKASQSNTYIGYDSWWGACGCWTSYTTGGVTGIPGFGPHNASGICQNYLALYARIATDPFQAFVEKNALQASNFYEY